MNGLEFVLIAVIAVFVLGPDRLPEYAAKLARGIRKLRVMAEGAKDQLKDQLGPEYEDINWQQYDPRQYDPRRIVKEALLDPLDDAITPVRDEIGSVRSAASVRGADTSAVTAGAAAGAVGVAAQTAQRSSADPAVYSPMGDSGFVAPSDARTWDPARPTPWDPDAT